VGCARSASSSCSPSPAVERVSEAAGTLGYELACGITRRVRFIED
jgi:alanine racemase